MIYLAKVILTNPKTGKTMDLEKALKIFKSQVEQEGIIKKYREKMYYKSKGEKNREKAKASRKKQLQQMRKQLIIDKKDY